MSERRESGEGRQGWCERRELRRCGGVVRDGLQLFPGESDGVLCEDVVDETGEGDPEPDAVGEGRRGRLEGRVPEEEVMRVERQLLWRLIEHGAEDLFETVSSGLEGFGVDGVLFLLSIGGLVVGEGDPVVLVVCGPGPVWIHAEFSSDLSEACGGVQPEHVVEDEGAGGLFPGRDAVEVVGMLVLRRFEGLRDVQRVDGGHGHGGGGRRWSERGSGREWERGAGSFGHVLERLRGLEVGDEDER